MYTIPVNHDFEFKNKFEIDPAEIMLHFINIIENSNNYKQEFNNFVCWVEMKTKKQVNDAQKHKLAIFCYNYITSKPESEKRSTAMRNIFNLEFLD